MWFLSVSHSHKQQLREILNSNSILNVNEIPWWKTNIHSYLALPRSCGLQKRISESYPYTQSF